MRYSIDTPVDFTKPVQTRNGLPVRILCTDRCGTYPIVALVDCGKTDCIGYFHGNGRCDSSPAWDLVNVPPPKKTVYVNIYLEEDVVRYCIKSSRKNADMDAGSLGEKRIACVKIEYTEGQFDE